MWRQIIVFDEDKTMFQDFDSFPGTRVFSWYPEL